MSPKKGTKTDWMVMSARVPPDVRQLIIEKHKNAGDINKLINALLKKYAYGKIIGIKLET